MLFRRGLCWAYAICALPMLSCGASAAKPETPSTLAARPKTPEAVYRHGDEKLTVEVGSAGGRLALENGGRLEIPEGALSETVEITIAEGAPTTAFANRDHDKPVGPLLEVAPPLNFKRPVRLSVPLAALPLGFEASHLTLAIEVPTERQRAVESHSTQTRWDYVPASSNSGRAEAKLEQVLGFRMQFVVSKND